MIEYCVEIKIRKRGFVGWVEYLFDGLKWKREFESRKCSLEIAEVVKHNLDGIIADIETIDNFN